MKIKLKIVFTAVCFQIAVFCFSQTEEQKQMMYEEINQDSGGKSKITSKIEPIANKEVLFANANVFPVYHFELNEYDKPFIVQNKESFLIVYKGRVYVFFNDRRYMLFENRTEVKEINSLINSKKDFCLVYFTNYTQEGEVFNILITDKTFSYIIEKDKKYSSAQSYIESKFGSLEKYKENDRIEKKRVMLTLKDIKTASRVNYKWYENRCPKDTTLIVRKFIDQIRIATLGLTKKQEDLILRRIKDKFDPSEYVYNRYYRAYDQNFSLKSSIIERQKKSRSSDCTESPFKNSYDIYLYKINFMQDLLEILTYKQFQDYKDYMDLFYPLVYDDDNLLTNERYTYGIELFKKEFNVKAKDRVELKLLYDKYFGKEYGPFDCQLEKAL